MLLFCLLNVNEIWMCICEFYKTILAFTSIDVRALGIVGICTKQNGGIRSETCLGIKTDTACNNMD